MDTLSQGPPVSDDIHKLVQHHDGELRALNTRMGHVEQKIDTVDGKLDHIITAVAKQDAQPKFEWRSTMGVIKDFGVIFTMVCAGILYLAAQHSNVDIALVKRDQDAASQRLERVESLILPENWASKTERRK